ncbi:MAG TPA: efflux RND transporter periplasmic adaptor subunit [Thermoanaerobaculia bacterium]|jgi:HlyD family secretion protein|nr:efflux RND transporter periplasmic adaptor subunit [Thermoanaerobaculia bacterium]
MRRRTKIIIGIVVLIIAGVLTAGFASRRGKDVTPVTFGKVTRQDLTSKVSANGRIDAKRKVDLSANVMGQVVNLAVREGDIVKKDDFLLQIDQKQLAATARSADAALQAVFSDRDAAKAMAVAADQDYQRALKNYEQKITPRSELDRAQSSRDSARANVAALEQRISQARENLNAARDTLQKTTMRAPMAGVVTALPVEEGEVAVIGTMNNAGTVLMTIADMSVVEAVMEVDETDVPSVKVGQRATVTIDAYPNKTFAGLVTEVASSPIKRNGIGAASSTEAVNFEVKIQIENPPAGVRPGFSASADIITGTRPKALAIPIQALVVREKPGSTPGKPLDEEGVFAIANGAVKFQPVKTGLSGDSNIEIVSGAKEGEQIVTGPFRALREIKDGTKVKEQKEEKDGGAGGDKKS